MIISVITAVHPPAAEYLPQAYESLQNQALPQGWEWEWIVQEDGDTGHVAPLLPTDPRIRFGPGEPAHNPGITRNLGLARSQGTLIKVLDADDQLTPGALARDIDAMTRPEVGWCTAAVLDLLETGEIVSWDEPDPPNGPLPKCSLVEWWRTHDYRPPVHPATLCIHRQLLIALGGWMALPASEDTGLLLAASTITPGWFTSEPGMIYRKWQGQLTSTTTYTSGINRTDRMTLIDQRVTALSACLNAEQDLPS